jgi:hypothetical protein
VEQQLDATTSAATMQVRHRWSKRATRLRSDPGRQARRAAGISGVMMSPGERGLGAQHYVSYERAEACSICRLYR